MHFLLLLTAWGFCASAQEPPPLKRTLKTGAGVLIEDYSFTGPGHTLWSNAAVPLWRDWAALAGVDNTRRFGFNDTSGRLGAAWKGEGKGGYAQVHLSPKAVVLPRWGLDGAWDQSLAKGLYAEVGAGYSDYIPAHVFSQSAALFWWATRWTELFTRAALTSTDFRHSATIVRPGFLEMVNIYPRGEEGPRLSPSIGYYEEPFEAGSPGTTHTFRAWTYHVGAGAPLVKGLEAKADWEYERRDDHTFVRRYTLGLSYQY